MKHRLKPEVAKLVAEMSVDDQSFLCSTAMSLGYLMPDVQRELAGEAPVSYGVLITVSVMTRQPFESLIEEMKP